jgi:TM2 domain-containing membrane protein YozV
MSDILLLENHTAGMSERQKTYFLNDYTNRKRSTGAVVGFALLLGGLGVHQFYLRRHVWGAVYLVSATVGWFIIVPPFVVGVLCIIDACMASSLVSKCNNAIAREIKAEANLLENNA